MRRITVDPALLEACAARMEDSNTNYLRSSSELFAAVDEMSAAWQGKDNTAFTTEISKFASEIRNLSILCTQYADFLKGSASAYRQTQDDLAVQAGSLAR